MSLFNNNNDGTNMVNSYPQNYQSVPMGIASGDRADLLDKIQPYAIVDVIFHKLLGEIDINGEWVKVPSLQRRALTIQGAWDISTLMTPVSSQNVSLSKLNDREIRARALNICKTAQKMCLRNWKEYGIKGTEQLWFVHELIFSNSFITLKQPEGEGIRRMLKDTMTGDISPPEEQNGMGFNLFRR